MSIAAESTALEQALRRYILTELAEVPERRLDLDAPLFETLLDSTSVLALVAHLESQYQIEVRDSEVVPDNFSTLRRLLHYLEAKRQPSAPPLAATG